MRRLTILFAILALCAVLAAQDSTYVQQQAVAKVGDYVISLSELEEEMDVLYDNSANVWTYEQLREAALQKLIDEQLMLHYAREASIVVSTREVDDYFISLYGDHHRFQTNGQFDRAKYNRAKQSENIQAILGDLNRELLVGKTRSIIESQFSIGDEELLDRYIYENFRFDLGYVIIDEKQADVDPELTPQDAYQWWRQRSDDYRSPRRVRLELLVVTDEELADEVYIDNALLLQAYADLTLELPFEEVKDSLAANMRYDQLRALSQRKAMELLGLLRRGGGDDSHTYATRWLEQGEGFGQLPQSHRMLEQAFTMQPRRWSQLYDLGWGWAAFQVAEVQEEGPASLDQVGRKVWRDYIAWNDEQSDASEYRDYFYTNIDSFIVPAAKISRIIIDPDSLEVDVDFGEGALRQYYTTNLERFIRNGVLLSFEDAIPAVRDELTRVEQHRLALELRRQVRDNIYNPRQLGRLADEYGVDYARSIVLLDRFTNSHPVDDEISFHIDPQTDVDAGELTMGNAFVIWRIHSVFMDYIPAYSSVRDEVRRMAHGETQDDFDYEAYFQRNISAYQTHDSLALAGVVIPIRPDTVQVGEWTIGNYYAEHPTDFYTPPQVLVDFVYIEDAVGEARDYTKSLVARINDGASMPMLQRVLGKPCVITPRKPVAMADLPAPVKNALEAMKPGELSEPIFHHQGWYIVRKIADYPPHLQPLDAVRDEIRRKLANYTALMNANRMARGVFEQAESFVECAQYADSTLLFQTELTEVSENYPVLGDILPYESKLMQLWNGEKYSSIVNADSAVAVVFLQSKSQAHRVTFEEALPRMKRTVAEDQRARRVRDYIRGLIRQIEDGADIDMLLPFFGVWREMKDLRLGSDLPGVEYSNQVLASIPDAELWEFSPPLSISEREYLFYRVSRIQKVHKEEFERNRQAYRHKLQRDAFEAWLQDYRTNVGVEVY